MKKKVGLDLFEKSFNWIFPHQILTQGRYFLLAKIRFIIKNQNLDFENEMTNQGQSRFLRHLQGVKISVENQLHLM